MSLNWHVFYFKGYIIASCLLKTLHEALLLNISFHGLSVPPSDQHIQGLSLGTERVVGLDGANIIVGEAEIYPKLTPLWSKLTADVIKKLVAQGMLRGCKKYVLVIFRLFFMQLE